MPKKLELVINEFIAYTQDNWKELLLRCIHEDYEDGEIDEEIRNLFEKLVYAMREILITENKQALLYIEQKFDNELTIYNELIKYIKEMLAPYYSFEPLRVIESGKPEKVHKIIDFIFNELILRFNPDFSKGYRKLGFQKEEDFEEVAFAISSLSNYVARKNYSKSVIRDMFQEVSRLNKENSAYIAEIIDHNIRELQLTVILDTLEDLEE